MTPRRWVDVNHAKGRRGELITSSDLDTLRLADADRAGGRYLAGYMVPPVIAGGFVQAETDFYSDVVTIEGDPLGCWPVTTRGQGTPKLSLNGGGFADGIGCLVRAGDALQLNMYPDSPGVFDAELIGPGFAIPIQVRGVDVSLDWAGQWNFQDNAATTTIVETFGPGPGTRVGNSSANRAAGPGGSWAYAQTFNGSTQWVNFGDGSGSYEPSGAFAISVWIYPTAVTTQYAEIWAKSDATGGSGTVYELRFNDTTGKLQGVAYIGGSLRTITGSTVLSNNVWRHVVFQWTGSQLELYIDNVADASPVACSGATGTTTEPMSVGARRLTAGAQFPFPGRIAGMQLNMIGSMDYYQREVLRRRGL